MIRRPLAAFSAALVWLTGNVVVVMSAPTLFAHAPPKAPANGITQDIASHEAAGALFGHVLRSWTTFVDYGPLPVLA
ncbi:MAG: hypothetical protein H0W83_12675, partial [Planctomycetes bacterium]|nr:hypothetical protein [Planctomycetota bacterium]